MPPLPERAAAGHDGRWRWDGQDLRAFTGTYGDYLLGKVSKVFPQLRRDVLKEAPPHVRPASSGDSSPDSAGSQARLLRK